MERKKACRGELCPVKAEKIFPLLKCVLLCVLLGMHLEDISAQSGQSPAFFSELAIGDKVPDEIWELPLEVVNHPNGKEIIRLSDFEGKVIILDFWSSYCSTCIVNMPYLHHLQSEFRDQLRVLPVTSQEAEKIVPFLQSNPVLRKLSVTSVVHDSVLTEVFPNETLPHIVVINGTGVVSAITLSEYLSKETIAGLINRDPNVYIPLKRSNFHVPLLTISSEYSDVKTYEPLYYSAIVGFTDGVDPAMSWEEDTSAQVNRLCIGNTFISKLYTAALRSPYPTTPQRRILLVNDPSRYIFDYQNYLDLDWRRSNFFTYEALLPFTFSESQARQKMKADLDAFFGLEGQVEKVEVPCLALMPTKEGGQRYKSKGGPRLNVYEGRMRHRLPELRKKRGPTPSGALTYVRNVSFNQVTAAFEYFLGDALPVILNETGYEGNYDLDFPDGPVDLIELRKELRKQGLDLVPVNRELEMFVLTESGRIAEIPDLQFTQYGYVAKEPGI